MSSPPIKTPPKAVTLLLGVGAIAGYCRRRYGYPIDYEHVLDWIKQGLPIEPYSPSRHGGQNTVQISVSALERWVGRHTSLRPPSAGRQASGAVSTTQSARSKGPRRIDQQTGGAKYPTSKGKKRPRNRNQPPRHVKTKNGGAPGTGGA